MAQGRGTATTTKAPIEIGGFIQSGFLKNDGAVDLYYWDSNDGDYIPVKPGQSITLDPWDCSRHNTSKVCTDRIWVQASAGTCAYSWKFVLYSDGD